MDSDTDSGLSKVRGNKNIHYEYYDYSSFENLQ